MRQRTTNELVNPDVIEAKLHPRHRAESTIFLGYLSTNYPIKIPPKPYDVMKAGPDTME